MTPFHAFLKGIPFCEQPYNGHGRKETRRHWICTNLKELDGADKWAGLKTIGKVERTRELTTGKTKGKISKETCYYICSIEPDAKFFAECIRSHWGVENMVHWTLDVTFREDSCQVRQKTAATNLSLLRKIAMNLFRKHPSKGGMKSKKMKAGWDVNFLEQIVCSTHA
jgi:predicted transposase YbfD/YdcC